MKGGGGEVEERSWLGAREEELARCPEERENRRVEGDSGREKQGREMEQEGERNERE